MDGDDPETKEYVIQRPGLTLTIRLDPTQFGATGGGAEEKEARYILRPLHSTADELMLLQQTAHRMVPGSHRPSFSELSEGAAEYSDSQLVVHGQQVMQDWERALMRRLAEQVAAPSHDVLEIGFGMGISASIIQELGVKTHTIVEANAEVFERAQQWRAAQARPADIHLVRGSWEEVADRLGQFDAVLFDAYEDNEEQYQTHTVLSSSWVASFFPIAAAHLRPRGAFTYFSDEVDSLDRHHQRALLEHFSEFTVAVCRDLRPPDDCNYWFWDQMAVVRAIK